MYLIALSLLFSFSPVTGYQSDYELRKKTNHIKEGILQQKELLTLAYIVATSEYSSGSEQLSKDFLSPRFTRMLRSNTIKANRIKNQEALNSSKLEYEAIIQNTLNPVAAPGASLTSYSFPSGPYITALMGNERIVIPDPPLPSMLSDPEEARSYCPHLDDDLHYWDDINTWGGLFPVADENITLPENTRVLIRESVAGILGFITVPQTSELIFGENDSGISLETKGISVIGNLTIGSETCRIRTPITITLHGDRPVDAVKNIRPPEYKGVSVTGRISMHGKRFYRTWTRLAQTVNIGESVIMLQHEVNWTPGQTIVLITTAMKDSREWHRNELAVVKKVIPNPVIGVGAAVILEEPVVYQHLAIRGYQGEVGLLTRTIKIQGNLASEPIDRDPLNCVQSQSINGDAAVPCPNTELTGFGGHIIIHSGGKGYVEGTELYRMGQTNVMGRYPMHFHLLGRSCQDCYFRDSSIHRSYYRCVSIHATDLTQISENVAYDVMGFCYYLEEGVEEENRLEFNLGALIHLIGPGPPTGGGQALQTYQKSDNLNLPADVAASAFYITNVKNYIVGNAASGGWAGYAFPSLPTPLGLNRDKNFRPSSVRELLIDGNSAHSTGWWWKSASAFYFGGSLYYNDSGVLEYQPGRDLVHKRSTCVVDKCLSGNCGAYCKINEMAWISMSNSKAYLVANIGLSSWGGRLELHGFECHDCGMAMAALASDGFFAKNVLAECRSQVPIVMPNAVRANKLRGDGFKWYDTGQEHILSDITFRNCGYRSNEYDHYDKGSTRGCGDESDIGCLPDASVWTFITHSDEHIPEVMQATRGVRFENCGRRFFFYDFRQSLAWHPSSVSGRCQNWLDIDGSVTGFNERSVAASGLADAGMWWQVDQEAVYDPEGPLWFFKLNSGPQRGLGSVTLEWDSNLESQIGVTQCGNGPFIPCDHVGRIKHLGERFEDELGLPMTANGDVVGAVGGFGWKLELDKGAPKMLSIREIEVDPSTPMLLSIAYPKGTSFNITAYAFKCVQTLQYTCKANFFQVDSISKVRNSLGNTYHVDSNGVLTFRIIQTPQTFVGRPDFFLPNDSDIGRNNQGFALDRFERDGIRLPSYADGSYMMIIADCPSSGAYCSDIPPPYQPNVCPDGYIQTAFDTCRYIANGSVKKFFADGTYADEEGV